MVYKKTKIEELDHIERFDSFPRFLHVLVIVSFLSLALTGMVIKFSNIEIFQTLASMIGGYEVTGFIHRFAALMTVAYFVLHLGYIIRRKKEKKRHIKYLFMGENTMVPQKRDLIEFFQTIKWFLGKGEKPDYGRWTYWEKFDYFAVFWGVFIIGMSGLILWFPVFFTSLGLPGWFINVATIIHSDEALLATGFIFTIHFFNTHFRPDKFPIDTVIFTGKMSLEEFKEDRPRQYRQMVEDGELEESLTTEPSERFTRISRIFGFTALSIGVGLVFLIIYSLLFV